MNANFKLSRQFAFGTVCAGALTLLAGFISYTGADYFWPDREPHAHGPWWPMLVPALLTGLLALVTVGVFLGALCELAFRRPGPETDGGEQGPPGEP